MNEFTEVMYSNISEKNSGGVVQFVTFLQIFYHNIEIEIFQNVLQVMVELRL